MKRRGIFALFARNRNLFLGAVMVATVILVALFADVIAPYNADDSYVADKFTAPCMEFPFGTDDFGRDMFSRVVLGSRISLRVAVMAAAIQIVLGVGIGLLAGFYGGNTDRVLSFAGDLTWAMPPIIMAMAVISVLGKGLNNVIIAIAVVSWAQYARVVRAKTQSLRSMPFVETGIAFNESDLSIMFKYILPNIVPSIIVLASLSIPSTILNTTALSFLGLGSMPPSPDWGLALSNSMTYMARAPWLAVFPGLALIFTVFGFNLLGEGLRDLLDPRMKAR